MSIESRAGPPATSIVTNGLPQPRFAWNRDEVAGAVGDLGTFLPHIIGAITVAGMAPTGIFTSFGLFYLLAGGFYGGAVGGPPMKGAPAGLLIVAVAPPRGGGGGVWVGNAFLLAR